MRGTSEAGGAVKNMLQEVLLWMNVFARGWSAGAAAVFTIVARPRSSLLVEVRNLYNTLSNLSVTEVERLKVDSPACYDYKHHHYHHCLRSVAIHCSSLQQR